jgi:hypothetical protein
MQPRKLLCLLGHTEIVLIPTLNLNTNGIQCPICLQMVPLVRCILPERANHL